MLRNYTLILLVAIVFYSQVSDAQSPYKPTSENLQSREWFQNARFGLFIHWGVYSLLGDGEWVMNNQNIAISDYEKLPQFFNPIDFDAEEWVLMAKNAGMKYITITSRHHDGFSMFDSRATTYDIVDATPYKKDILKELADACQKYDMKLFFYYSLLDWRLYDYFPRGRTGNGIAGRESGEWNNYIEFMKAQLTELCTNYGPIGGIWFDGHWDQMQWDGEDFSTLQVDWHYDELYSLIHRLQPQALIGNNHHLAPIDGEDFQMFERDLPGHNTTGWATDAEDVGDLPFEMCETINGSWGFALQDRKHKSSKELIHLLVKAAGYNSNLLLNVGPMPNGKIQPEHVQSLREVGEWLTDHGETIYGTTNGPVGPEDWGVSTRNGKVIFLHILDYSKDALFLDDFTLPIRKMSLFSDGTRVSYETGKYGTVIALPNEQRQDTDTIIRIELK